MDWFQGLSPWIESMDWVTGLSPWIESMDWVHGLSPYNQKMSGIDFKNAKNSDCKNPVKIMQRDFDEIAKTTKWQNKQKNQSNT